MPKREERREDRQEDGYRLWLRYDLVADASRLAEYRRSLTHVVVAMGSATLDAARTELSLGLAGLLGAPPRFGRASAGSGSVLVGTPARSPAIAAQNLSRHLAGLGEEGFVVRRVEGGGPSLTVIAANADIGILYGVFALLRHLQTHRPLAHLDLRDNPKLKLRMLDHWDNLDGTVERGYAGLSIWDWPKLPREVSSRYRDYARANASIGINAVAVNNVNSDARILTGEYLEKVAALASVFRPFGIRVYLSARFSAPIEIGGLRTADPLDAGVAAWWREKCREIHRHMPDFGGFLVKANSEGQPGPQDYQRTHADGANVLAAALAATAPAGMPGGKVLWRAFVYHNDAGSRPSRGGEEGKARNRGSGGIPGPPPSQVDRRVDRRADRGPAPGPTPDPIPPAQDRARQAYDDLTPLDGAFRSNALLQVKNGPIDFQPREPFHPLFGAMPKTPLVVEFQITQEYLGQGTHLVYLGPLFKETLDSDTFARGAGTTIGKVVAGIAGVANIGNDDDWCGHPFAAANWFAFGRLAWNFGLGADEIADDWLRMTFTNQDQFVTPVKAMMLESRDAAVNYMTPLGLHHLMAEGHHHGPGPWVDTGRADWTSVYYHRADSVGMGFDRSPTGSNAVAQYHPPWPDIFGDSRRCPEELLLWFHHVSWDHAMKSGRTLWDELCARYQAGVESARRMRAGWQTVGALIDRARASHVQTLLAIQEQEARWWHDACLLYFQSFSKLEFPPGCEPPTGRLDDFRLFKHSYIPDSTGGRPVAGPGPKPPRVP
jgi:alpha-glucuronidase